MTQPARPAQDGQRRPFLRSIFAICAMAALGACTSLGGAGPSTGSIREASEGRQAYADTGIEVIELDGAVARRLGAYGRARTFAQVFGDPGVSATVIAPGDVLDIAIWEAPPAVLFGLASPQSSEAPADEDLAANAPIPQQVVGEDGRISIPFVGRIEVLGLSPQAVEDIIVSRLRRRANDPQAIVRLVENESRTATILGEVPSSGRISLSARGERVLDALAEAGGTREPIAQSSIQLSRGRERAAMPLEQVIADPAQNVRLRPGDVVTVQHRPFSFVALGAVVNNQEVPFEGSGISLAEALGRVGGLNDRRADVKGIFVFRLEEAAAMEGFLPEDARTTAEGLVPVVYTLRMTDAASLFTMQDFIMRDRDVLYVSTAPGVELERFLTTISSTAFSIVATGNALDNR